MKRAAIDLNLTLRLERTVFSLATNPFVLLVSFALVMLLVVWMKYREHLHAHRREVEEHGHSAIRFHSHHRR
jgi:ABC-type nickel/cobalt efflux system permease component RcnA